MPYITQEDRQDYDNLLIKIATKIRKNKKVDIFKMTGNIADDLIREVYCFDLNYYAYNEIIGMLCCCLNEWVRRHDLEGYSSDDDYLMDFEYLDSHKEVNPIYKLLQEVAFRIKEKPKESWAGQLNYCITKLLTEVFSPYDRLTPLEKEDTVSILGGLLAYWYEHRVSPYEDLKIDVNGDVYSDRNLTFKYVPSPMLQYEAERIKNTKYDMKWDGVGWKEDAREFLKPEKPKKRFRFKRLKGFVKGFFIGLIVAAIFGYLGFVIGLSLLNLLT
jgi:hypothetical protein